MLTPEEIAERRFLVSLRGYDRDEVHAFLGELARQVGELQQRNAQLDEELERATGALQRQQADADAAPADASAAPAPEEPRRPFAEIGEETQRILEAAQDAGNQITRKARHDADRELQAARQRAAKVIADGERRREAIEGVVAGLEERRTAIAGQLRGVGQTIDQTIEELVPDDEAPTVREALAATVQPPGGGAGQNDHQNPAANGGPTTHDAEQAAVVDEEPGDVDGEPGDVDEEPGDVDEELGDVDEVAADADEVAVAADDAVAAVAAEANEELDLDPALAAGAEGGVDAGVVIPGLDEGPPPPVSHENGSADALTPEEHPAEEPIDAPPEDQPAAPGALRAGALEPLHPKMVRRVKRGLSDLQNICLDRLRREGDKADAASLEITDDELAGLGEVAGEFLAQAYQAGVDAAAVLAGRNVPAPQQERPLAEEFVADGASRIREPLAATLRMGLGSEEPLTALNDRIGAVFSELKSAAADELSATHLIKAYESGLLDAWAAGEITQRIWVLGREPRCPEGRCRQNDQSGAVDVTEPFPSGHATPPVHVGCTCTTIPALES